MDCNQITQNIHLGNINSPVNESYIKKHNIRYVINLSTLSYDKIEGVSYLDIPISDIPNANISAYFPLTNIYIDTAIKLNSSVLIHCYAGISRSTTIVIAYLISKGMNMSNAYNMVKMKRSIINPNSGFMNQLINYDKNINQQNKVNNNIIKSNNMMKPNNITINNNKVCNYCFINNKNNTMKCINCDKKFNE